MGIQEEIKKMFNPKRPETEYLTDLFGVSKDFAIKTMKLAKKSFIKNLQVEVDEDGFEHNVPSESVLKEFITSMNPSTLAEAMAVSYFIGVAIESTHASMHSSDSPIGPLMQVAAIINHLKKDEKQSSKENKKTGKGTKSPVSASKKTVSKAGSQKQKSV